MTAGDGDQAVKKYEQMLDASEPTVHAVLMDYHMPRMSGDKAIERIRAIEKERGVPPVPIAAYTAGTTAGNQNSTFLQFFTLLQLVKL